MIGRQKSNVEKSMCDGYSHVDESFQWLVPLNQIEIGVHRETEAEARLTEGYCIKSKGFRR
jgi:hypothetical protein